MKRYKQKDKEVKQNKNTMKEIEKINKYKVMDIKKRHTKTEIKNMERWSQRDTQRDEEVEMESKRRINQERFVWLPTL